MFDFPPHHTPKQLTHHIPSNYEFALGRYPIFFPTPSRHTFPNPKTQDDPSIPQPTTLIVPAIRNTDTGQTRR